MRRQDIELENQEIRHHDCTSMNLTHLQRYFLLNEQPMDIRQLRLVKITDSNSKYNNILENGAYQWIWMADFNFCEDITELISMRG